MSALTSDSNQQPPCTPISWLELELFALGEAKAPERIEAHLASCERCTQALSRLRLDTRSMPALPIAVASRAPSRWRRLLQLAPVFAVLVVAMVWMQGKGSDEPSARWGAGVKGGDIAIKLLRERNGALLPAERFAEGDRFKLLVSCSPERGHVPMADVLVLEEGQRSFPLPPQRIECGNEVALPGAFALSGTRVEVCLLLARDRAPSREQAVDDKTPCLSLSRDDH